MSLTRVGTLLGKDLQLGPRSPLVLWALVLPVVITFVLRGVFGGLFASEPRLGIVDLGGSALVAQALALDGIEVRVLDVVEDLHAQVETGDLDAGLVLAPGFDAAVRAGERPALDFVVGGTAFASDRILLGVTTLDLVRTLDAAPALVDVEVVVLGEAGIALDLRMLPLIVLMSVAIAGAMVPAAGLVEEKEKGTLQAVLATPTTMSEFLLAKGLLGVVLAMAAGTITLAVNGLLLSAPPAALVGIAVGGVMMAQIGLMAGAWAPDTNTLFTAWKLGGLVLFYPVVVYLWPELPGWIGRLSPTWYFLQPVWAVTIEGAPFARVWRELAIATGICVALVPAVAATGRWLEHRLGTGRATTSATIDS